MEINDTSIDHFGGWIFYQWLFSLSMLESNKPLSPLMKKNWKWEK